MGEAGQRCSFCGTSIAELVKSVQGPDGETLGPFWLLAEETQVLTQHRQVRRTKWNSFSSFGHTCGRQAHSAFRLHRSTREPRNLHSPIEVSTDHAVTFVMVEHYFDPGPHTLAGQRRLATCRLKDELGQRVLVMLDASPVEVLESTAAVGT